MKIPSGAISRRTFLRGAAGGAVLAAAGGLPAWARPTGASHHRRKPDSLPFPHMPAGTPSMKEIKHIVVLMMENHSFDNLLGMVPHQLGGRHGIDGLTVNRHGHVTNSNPGKGAHKVHARHAPTPARPPTSPARPG